MMARFFVEPAELSDDQIFLTGENAQHGDIGETTEDIYKGF